MSRTIARLRGSLRLARGRCPSCRSESHGHCGVCLDHRGPFPVGPETLARWRWRYESELRMSARPLLDPAVHADPIGRHA